MAIKVVSKLKYRAPAGFEASLKKMAKGFSGSLPAGFALQTARGALSPTEAAAQLQSIVSLYAAVAKAKLDAAAAIAQANQRLEAALPAAHSLFNSLRDALTGYYGRGAQKLDAFGVRTKTAPKPSPIKNAVKAAKARQTRIQNGTIGKRQKAKLALQQELTALADHLAPKVRGK